MVLLVGEKGFLMTEPGSSSIQLDNDFYSSVTYEECDASSESDTPEHEREDFWDDWDDCDIDDASSSADLNDTHISPRSAYISSGAGSDRAKYDQRGRYSRVGCITRQSHADQAAAHWAAITSSGLAGGCSVDCAFGGRCLNKVTKDQLFTFHEELYGLLAWVSKASREKRLQSVSYGKNHFNEKKGEYGCWSTAHREKKTQSLWRSHFESMCSYDSESNCTLTSKACSMRMCEGATRNCMGIPHNTWKVLRAAANRGPAELRTVAELHDAKHDTARDKSRATTTRFSECVQWWLDIFPEWDIMPNEAPPVIQHPHNLIWEELYDKLYVPEMEFSTCEPLRQKDGKAPGNILPPLPPTPHRDTRNSLHPSPTLTPFTRSTTYYR